MDEFIQGLITGAPNLAVALLVLFWQHRMNEKLVDYLIEQNKALASLVGDGKEETG